MIRKPSVRRCSTSLLALASLAAVAVAQHPGPQPRPGPSTQTQVGDTTFVVTPESHFPPSNPFLEPPGGNFLLTVESNMFDGNGAEMPSTLPSTAAHPYNLHDGPVIETPIDPRSPRDDLDRLLHRILNRAHDGGIVDQESIATAIDILEGNPVPGRSYSGFPLLHYNGPEKVGVVEPIFDAGGIKIGGNLEVHQVWYDTHIESDTAFIDPSAVLDVPWTITYVVDVLERGHDDFSPFVMYFDDPALTAPNPPLPHVAMDQTFFPMEDGHRYVFKIKMSKGKYYNLTYTWGWRVHPPRVQVSERATKKIADPADGTLRTLPEWEEYVFGPAPTSSEAAKRRAIGKIGNLSPAKTMWKVLRRARTADAPRVTRLMRRALRAFDDWKDRSRLPRGVAVDPAADMTLLYVNNTIYGEMTGGGRVSLDAWQTRPFEFKVTLLNGDYFRHAYMNVDFGGSRGWENQFQSTVALAGSGCWFSFGRVHWWPNAGAPPWGLVITVPRGHGRTPGVHKVDLTLNLEPSRRLRLYQFDPLHHDVAVMSIH